jgi:hypothetical protein
VRVVVRDLALIDFLMFVVAAVALVLWDVIQLVLLDVLPS